MQISVFTSESIMVIDKSKKPWSMDGRNGITYKAICHKKIDDEVQVEEVRITEEVYNFIEPMTRYTFDGTVDVKNSRLLFTGVHPAGNPSVSPNNSSSSGNTEKPKNTGK